MHRSLKSILMALLLAAQLAAAPRPFCTVTYIANEGFLLEAGGRKALVDALFSLPEYWSSHTPERLDAMIQGRPPFDRVDLLLVTHPHRDHFAAEPVAAFLRHHPETTLVTTREAVEALRIQEGFAAFQARTRGIAQRVGGSTRIDLPGIRVDTLQLHHAGGQTWNLAFHVDLGGFRFFHTGDVLLHEVAEELRGFPFRELRPDALFLENWDTSPESRSLIARCIQPTHLVPMHFAEKDPEEARKAREAFPAGVFFERPLQSRRLEPQDTPWKPEGDYLGQPLPGQRPLIFARGLVSSENREHSAPAFSADGNEVFWTVVRRPAGKRDWPLIVTSRRVDGVWSEPAAAPFSGEHNDGGPAFSADGKRLYFHSTRPLKPGGPARGLDLWVIEKTGEAWGEPRCLGFLERFPHLGSAASPSVAANGSIYFNADGGDPSTRWALFRCAWTDGQYGVPERLPTAINVQGRLNMTPCIAPDERFLLFVSDRQAPDREARDLWVSHRRQDDTWTEPTMLPEPVNAARASRFPGLSPDGKVLFFTRPVPGRNDDVFWVGTESIGALKAPVTDKQP